MCTPDAFRSLLWRSRRSLFSSPSFSFFLERARTDGCFLNSQTELEKEKTRKDGGDSAWIERTRRTEAELDWAKEMADRLDRVNQGLSRENVRLKGQFKSQEDDRKFLIKQLVAIKVQ